MKHWPLWHRSRKIWWWQCKLVVVVIFARKQVAMIFLHLQLIFTKVSSDFVLILPQWTLYFERMRGSVRYQQCTYGFAKSNQFFPRIFSKWRRLWWTTGCRSFQLNLNHQRWAEASITKLGERLPLPSFIRRTFIIVALTLWTARRLAIIIESFCFIF